MATPTESSTTRKKFCSRNDFVVRIYWQHDLDIVALCYYKDFSVSNWMKQALIAYVRGDKTFTIPVPEEQIIAIEKKTFYAHFALDEESEADVIEFLESFRYGFRTNGIKQIMRLYLSPKALHVYSCSSLYTVKPMQPKSKQQIFKKKHHYDYSKDAFPEKLDEPQTKGEPL